MKKSADEQLTRRFVWLNACVMVVILGAIAISISQFGAEAWEGRRQVGFILRGGREDPGWSRVQYRGIQRACEEEGCDLLLRENVPATPGACRQVVQELAKKGAQTIILVHDAHLADVEDVIQNYPRIQFYAISSRPPVPNVVEYAIRTYEVRYLAGILAGLRTKTNCVGYVAPFASPEVNQGINAFALGVRRSNPQAQVLLSWAGDWDDLAGEEQAVRNLKAEHVDVMAHCQNGKGIADAAQRAGMDFFSCYEAYPEYSHCIGSLRIDCKEIDRDILRRELQNDPHMGIWVGLVHRMVNLDAIGSRLHPRERAVLETERWEILQGRPVFSGEIYDRNGVLRCGAGEAVSDQLLQQMDWLVTGVRIIGNG